MRTSAKALLAQGFVVRASRPLPEIQAQHSWELEIQ